MSARMATLAGAVLGLSLLTAAPAWANETININPGNIAAGGTSAANYAQGCDIGGGPYADKDVWVFVLPGEHSTSGDFVSVTAHFDTDGNGSADTTKTISADGGGFVNGGPQAAKAYIALPQGWRLTGASAVITGTADKFNLTHTCAAGSSASASPSPRSSTPGSASPSPETPGSGTPTPGGGTPTPGGSESTTPGGPGSSSSPSTPGLPITGASLTTPLISGLVLAAGGALLMMLFRRRRNRLGAEE